ncbi:hypothetical protein DPQ33_10150 [Oceanidesulfovibrio indonesiensis]|uniref:Uncharacterized protein n=2 Tax=Oceanidesulfovibrio indonesiensis TaxID=54767 RepID=A0A7M3MEB8_9BACT|nr:hypothetical protein DPQ33_10150 [Oceanidesulfovibrio indonesiensis]
MIPPSLSKWDNDKNLNGLLFFAQRMCELLYDQTLDSYKVPALNTHTSILEVRALIERFASGHIPQRTYFFALAEAKKKISDEAIFSLKEKERLLRYVKSIEIKEDKSKIRKDAAVLAAEVYANYWTKLKQKVVEVVSVPNKKKEIEALCTNLAVEIQNRGYHKGYMFHKTAKFFFQ